MIIQIIFLIIISAQTYVVGTYLKVIDRVVVMNTHNLQSFQSFKKHVNISYLKK